MNVAVSRFTPSNLPAAVLERLFVARHDLLDDLASRARRAATSTERNHSLVVGPRGAGKTHLISLLHHRVSTMAAEGVAVQAAWLHEDPYLVSSYRDLLTQIADAIGVARERGATVHDLEAQLLDAHRRGGVIVVLAENFDTILHAIGEDGQHRLRHFLQTEPALLLAATTTTVTRDLNDEAWPFYGFFTTDTLAPLTIDQAAQMLQLIAAENGDDKLVAYLGTGQARARLRAIEHLAGGQPRIWAVLATSLTVTGLDELVSLLLRELDSLTPYYQEQMARLSPLQRRTVAHLIDAEGAVTVSELAQSVEVDQRTMAKTLGELRRRQWVRTCDSPFAAWLDRRLSFYELAEPLARIAFQIKAARSTPIRLIVDFMKMWFEPDALRPAGGTYGKVAGPRRTSPDARVPNLDLLARVDDALHDLAGHDAARLLTLPVPLRQAIEERLGDPASQEFAAATDLVRAEVIDAALDELGAGPHERSASWIPRIERWLDVTENRAAALARLTEILARNWRFDDAMLAMDSLARGVGDDHPIAVAARSNLADIYRSAGRHDDATHLDQIGLTRP